MPLTVVNRAQPHDVEGLAVIVVMPVNVVNTTADLAWLLNEVAAADGIVELTYGPYSPGVTSFSAGNHFVYVFSALWLFLMALTVILSCGFYVLFSMFCLVRLLTFLAGIQVTVSHHLVLVERTQ